ncbi:intradiol ring-cleavage dioxygenase [Deinococcus cellulosilyticus]|uniref:Protocatechuate dioxygenase n=1 Tax=Deinococcus cellulosilyticus (strain DSM 18568 / NBRC 106333 / KACC 11606 / 5516J-15) TaxID=1223518 RepID=A0A511MX25_DEIC1|nr:intradiol ring-cleavage dioxygenase [Deinococcus cellulosilyticus]GEM45133.1 protocatechuate dioxygenase [Deinococcus cellulosilyticus NBRC 106333 = KACC 11606]
MDNDDQPIGKVLSRRQALRLFGLAGGSAVGAAAIGQALAQRQTGAGSSAGSSGVQGLPGCVVRPAMTEGPYWVDEKLNRSDVRKDTRTGVVKAGVPLTLVFQVSRVALKTCEPRSGVMVDIWHCDADGIYSDASDRSFDTRGQNFLRGYQLTNAKGEATFKTIYPGWYSGRAVHIHYRLRTLQNGKVTGDFASQLFFDESVTDRVHAVRPYKDKGKRDTPNSSDMLYKNGGSQMMLKLTGSPEKGYTATFDIGLNIG